MPETANRKESKMSLHVKSESVPERVEVYGPLFKPVPYVPDKGLDLVLKELSRRRSVPKEFRENPNQFRDHGPLEKLVKEGWVDRLYKSF